MRDGWPFTYIVFEYITGKDLLHIVDRDDRLPEPQARMYFSQLVSAVDYAHSLGIAHRDIKVLLPPIASSPFFHPSQLQPENILVDKFTSRLVLIDFGLSSFMQPGTTFQDYCGSPR
jgi:serine/threonine protein kinase